MENTTLLWNNSSVITADLLCFSPISNLPKYQKIVFATLFGFNAAVASFLNVGLLILFLKAPSLRNKSDLHLLSLSIGDVIIGVIMSPTTVKQILTENYQNCFVNKLGALVSVSGVAIFVITYDRYVHIWKGTSYDEYMTNKRFLLLISCPWLTPLILIMAKSISEECFTWAILFAYILVYSATIASYLKIVTVLHSRVHAEYVGNNNRLLIQRQNEKAVRLICLISVTFILMTSGTLLNRIFMTCHFYLPDGFIWFKQNEPTVRAFGQILFQLNSQINPILYYSKHATIRSEVKRYVRICQRRLNMGTGQSVF